ncbi:MAG: TlpA family protein disulfide reductase [Chthoniobacteraceae bacterium]
MMMPRLVPLALCAALLATLSTAQASPNAEADWQAVLALEAGPQNLAGVQAREQIRDITLSHLYKQEGALRQFLREHPESKHFVDAQLCLSRLFAVRSDFSGSAEDLQTAVQILRDGMASAPAGRRADFDFASLTLSVGAMNNNPSTAQREAFTSQVLTFRLRYPGDRRIAPLLAETAVLYDNDPKRKNELLGLAQAEAQTPEVQARIQDDIKRLGFLGKPVEVRGTSATGGTMDVANLRGMVVMVYFFAGWSAPSMAQLDQVESLRKAYEKDGLAVVGVNLDASREELDRTLKAHNLDWTVLFDGKGWKSPLVRSLSINAIPALWVFDRRGNLRTLNLKGDPDAFLRPLLAEK